MLATLILTLRTMLAQPFAMDVVARLNGDRQMGTAYGVYYPWLLLAAVGGASALAVSRLDQSGSLDPADAVAAARRPPGAMRWAGRAPRPVCWPRWRRNTCWDKKLP